MTAGLDWKILQLNIFVGEENDDKFCFKNIFLLNQWHSQAGTPGACAPATRGRIPPVQCAFQLSAQLYRYRSQIGQLKIHKIKCRVLCRLPHSLLPTVRDVSTMYIIHTHIPTEVFSQKYSRFSDASRLEIASGPTVEDLK